MPEPLGHRANGRSLKIRIAAILAVMLALGWFVGSFTLASAVVRGNPELALRLAPYRSDTQAAVAENLLLSVPSNPPLDRIRELSSAALRRSPLSVVGARTLAFSTVRDEPLTNALMDYAGGLSRRDLPTNLWMIERSVNRGDRAGALDRYDITLRSSDRSQAMLFPVLLGALQQESYVQPIAQIFRRRPNWVPAFVDFAVAQRRGTENLAIALRGVPLQSPPGENIPQEVVDQLIKEQHYASALTYAASVNEQLRKGRRGLRDGRFEDNDGLPPFSWRYVSDAMYGALRGDHGATIYASSGASGVALGQLVLLQRGDYVLTTEGHISGGGAEWVVDCAAPANSRLISLAIPAAAATAQATFKVREGCGAQYIRLSVQSSDLTGGLTGEIRKVAISPVTR